MVLSVLVQAQLRRAEHICLTFVQCWEKTSLHSLCHRGCHCRIAAAGEESQPSESDPRPLAAARHHQQSGGAYFCIFVIFICTSYSSFTFFYTYSDMNLNIQAKERVTWCAAYFASHTVQVMIKFTFFRRVTCHEPRIGTRKASNCPVPNKLACPQKP